MSDIPEHKLILRQFTNEQQAKARQIKGRLDELGLDECIKVVDRVIADYLELREKLCLLRA